jgi:sulfur carrier protein ThiS
VLTLVLPTALVDLLPEPERAHEGPRSSVPLDADCWWDMVEEVRERFPDLAARVLTESGAVAPRYALVVNDDVVPGHDAPVEVRPGDEIAVVAIIAGGRSPHAACGHCVA